MEKEKGKTVKASAQSKKSTAKTSEKRLFTPTRRNARTAAKPTAPSVLLTIVDRGKGIKVHELYSRYGVLFTTVMHGNGTASSEILDILGLDSAEKDVVISTASTASAKAVMDELNDRLSGHDCGKGIACRMKMCAVANLLAKSMEMSSKKPEVRRVSEKEKYVLIIITVNQGYADEVMASAKKAGARGGTLMRGRQLVNDNAEGLFGDAVTPERELLFILARADKRNDIMESVNAEHGVRTEAGAVVFALSVDEVAKLG